MNNETHWDNAQKKIKTFAYQSFNSFHKSYKSWLIKYRERKDLLDTIKIGIVGGTTLLFGALFLYYVNLASTRGYFMKIATQELTFIKEKGDIVKLEVINKKKENRDNLETPSNYKLQQSAITLEIPELNEILEQDNKLTE